MINVFQEQLVTGQKTARQSGGKGRGGSNSEPMVNLANVTTFEEYFYLVVVEKSTSGASVLHMWQIVLSSQGTLQPQGQPRPQGQPQGQDPPQEIDKQTHRIKQNVQQKG